MGFFKWQLQKHVVESSEYPYEDIQVWFIKTDGVNFIILM